MRRILQTIAFAAATLLAAAAGAQSIDEEWSRCEDVDHPDIAIAGCTAVIESGRETGDRLAVAFNRRGVAYASKGEYDRAIEDFDEAIRLDPNYAGAYYNRGLAKQKLGDMEGAKADLAKAKELEGGGRP